MTNCTRQLWTLFIEIVSGSQTKFSQGMVLARQAFASEKSSRDRPGFVRLASGVFYEAVPDLRLYRLFTRASKKSCG
jgi:hypothetical protein